MISEDFFWLAGIKIKLFLFNFFLNNFSIEEEKPNPFFLLYFPNKEDQGEASFIFASFFEN